MALPIKSTQELIEIFLQEFLANQDKVTDDSEGSLLDIHAGTAAVATRELSERIVDEFRKTFFSTARGPEATGGEDELEKLAIDHFGDDFARPEASPATGIVTFQRANDDAGDCTIPAGTIVQTGSNANGEKTQFQTLLTVVMTGTSVNASVEALVAGTSGNIEAEEIEEIESTLTDPTITVNNTDEFADGEDEATDSEYLEFIRDKIQTLKGATLAAIEAQAKIVSGVETAKIIELVQWVKNYDPVTEVISGDAYRICRPILYVADANGSASTALLASVRAAIETIRAAGVKVEVEAAVGIDIDWTALLTLNPSGPNYSTLSGDSSKIRDTMIDYVAALAIGADFILADARAYVLSIWGPSGTDDLTDFTNLTPVGNVAIGASEKAVPGEISA